MMSQEQQQRDFAQFVQQALPYVQQALGQVFASLQQQGTGRAVAATTTAPSLEGTGGGMQQQDPRFWGALLGAVVPAVINAIGGREMQPQQRAATAPSLEGTGGGMQQQDPRFWGALLGAVVPAVINAITREMQPQQGTSRAWWPSWFPSPTLPTTVPPLLGHQASPGI
ncbi:MAG: hypothetical protein AB1351_02325 [Thermoproteota archaeon]